MNIFKISLNYLTGGILLGILNIILFALTGKPWRITTGFLLWGAWIIKAFGGQPENWEYFKDLQLVEGLNDSFFTNNLSLLALGMVCGSLLAVLLASHFKMKKIKSWRYFITALLGGIIMGYGTRIAFGCNIGAFFSAIPSMSLHGWVFGIFIFVGAWIGCKILVRFLV